MTEPSDLTQAYLKECLDYDPATGVFRWKVRPVHHFHDDTRLTAADVCKGRNSRFAGLIAGAVNNHGYHQVQIGDRKYRAHRLAWFYTYGEWPRCDVDHIDGNRLNNRTANLRLASRSENVANSKLGSGNTSGVKGVKQRQDTGRWEARIGFKYKLRYLGLFDTIEEAQAAYMKAAEEFFGEFARAS